MKCPICEEEYSIYADVAFENANQFGGACLVKTKCCEKLTIITPLRFYELVEYSGDRTEDDWGYSV